MAIVTILPALTKNRNLFAVPRDVYEEFLAWQKAVKAARKFVPNVSEKKTLRRARKNFSNGKYTTLEQLKYELGVTR